MRSISKLMVVIVPLLLLFGCSDDDGGSGPQVNPNTAWFEEVSGAPGDQVTMQIMIHNAEPIIFVQMPFVFSDLACSVASVEFGGPFASPILSNLDEDPDPDRCNVWAAVATPIPAGDHLFATVNIDIAAEATSQTVMVEDYSYIGSFSLDPGNDLYRHFPNFGTIDGKAITIEVTQGSVTIVAPSQ